MTNTMKMKEELNAIMALSGSMMGEAMLNMDADDVDGDMGVAALKMIGSANRLMAAYIGWSEEVEKAAKKQEEIYEKMEQELKLLYAITDRQAECESILRKLNSDLSKRNEGFKLPLLFLRVNFSSHNGILKFKEEYKMKKLVNKITTKVSDIWYDHFDGKPARVGCAVGAATAAVTLPIAIAIHNKRK